MEPTNKSELPILEEKRQADILTATSQFLTGCKHVAAETNYGKNIQTIELIVAPDRVIGELFNPKGNWETDTGVLGTWNINFDSVGAPDLTSDHPTGYIVTLTHVPPGKTDNDPRSFRFEFIVSMEGVSGFDIRHPLTRLGHEREVERSEKTTVEYVITTIIQMGRLLTTYR